MRPASLRVLCQSAALTLALAFVSCTNDNSLTQPGMQRLYTTPTGRLSATPPEILVGAGDIASCGNNNDEATAQLLDAIPGTVMAIGDNVYNNGTTSEFANCYDPTWGRHKGRTRPSTGNHEYNTSGAAPYYAYFGASAGVAGQGYYSYELGAWHIIVLNSSISMSAGSAQDTWLRNDLAAHPNLCTLSYFHHPLYSSTGGSGSGGIVYSGVRRPWDVMYPAGVDLVLGGHRHFYERIAPMKPDGTRDDATGIREIIVGSGGIGGGSLTNAFPLTETGNGNTFGVLKLYLYEDSYAWKFVPVPGKTYTDSGSTACHGAPGSGGGGGGVSGSLSTLSANPTALTAGSGASTITVTVKDGSGNPINGATVVLAATGTGNTITQPASTTNSSGVATGTISSTGAGQKTVSATANGVSIAQTAIVTVAHAALSAAQSTVAASPTSISQGGGSSTITVTAKDAFGNPISGSTVDISATGSGNTLVDPANPTDVNGVATGSLASTVVESKIVSAMIDGTPITQTATVSVTPPGQTGTISHALLTSGGNGTNQSVFTTASFTPTANALITVAVRSRRSGGALTPTLSGGGMTSWTLVGTVDYDLVSTPLARVAVFRAMSASPGSGPLTISFSSSVSNADWIVSQWTGVETSGVNGAGAVAQMATNQSDAATSLTVPLAPFGDANNVGYGVVGVNANVPAVTPGSGLTEIAEATSGESTALEAEWGANQSTIQASFSASRRAGLLAMEIKAGGGGGGGPTVDPGQSSVTASPTSFTVGSGSSTITVTARDGGGTPISGASVVFAASGSGNTLTPATATTNGSGVATSTLTSSVAELKDVSATINGVAVTQHASVTVNPPGPSVSASLSTVGASPTSFTAGGSSAITVTVLDGSGTPMSGVAVTLSSSAGSDVVTQPASTTDGSGVATGSVAATIAGPRTITAVAGGVTLNQTPALTVGAGAPNAGTSTVSANPTSITAGSGSSTITVTVKDAFGNLVSGSNVVLAATGSGNTLTGGGLTVGGVATGSLSSTVAEIKTVSATADATPITQQAQVTVTPPGSSTIAQTLLTGGSDVTNARIYTTASVAPAANALVTIAVIGHQSSAASASPTITGGGMSGWVEVATITFSSVTTPLKRMSIFRAMSAAPGSGPITITFPTTESNASWIVSQWTGVDQSGTNGSGAIGQTVTNRADGVTSITAALAPLGGSSNVAYGVVGTSGTAIGIVPGASFSEISEQKAPESPNSIIEAMWAANQTAPSASWAGAFAAAILAIEIKAAP